MSIFGRRNDNSNESTGPEQAEAATVTDPMATFRDAVAAADAALEAAKREIGERHRVSIFATQQEISTARRAVQGEVDEAQSVRDRAVAEATEALRASGHGFSAWLAGQNDIMTGQYSEYAKQVLDAGHTTRDQVETHITSLLRGSGAYWNYELPREARNVLDRAQRDGAFGATATAVQDVDGGTVLNATPETEAQRAFQRFVNKVVDAGYHSEARELESLVRALVSEARA